MRSSFGTGRYAASENDVFLAEPAGWAGGVRGALYFHVAGATASTFMDSTLTGELHLIAAIAKQYPVLSIDAGGQSWGNATALARAADGQTRLQGTPITPNGPYGAKAGKIILIGSSMGAQLALNYAKANPTLVACVVGIIPVVDVQDIVTNNRAGLAASVNAAYGGAYSNATYGATYNPAVYAASYNIPTQLWYASDDTTTIASAVTAFAAAAQNVTATSVGALGHTSAAVEAVPRASVLSFIAKYA